MKADLENYYNNNGIIFFVVEIVDYDNFKIFYLSLLPIDIKDILAKLEDKKSIQLEFKKLPETKGALDTICRNFILHSRKQGHSLLNDIKIDINSFKSLKSTIITTHNSFASDLLEYGTYAYGYNDDLNLDVPLYKMNIESVEEETDIDIGTGGEKFYTATRIISKNDTFIDFGRSFRINLNQLKLKKLDINFSLKGTIRERIYDLNYLMEIINNKSIEINDDSINLSSINLSEKILSDLPAQIKELEELEVALNKLNIDLDIDPTKLSHKETFNLKVLKEIVIDKDFSRVKHEKDRPFIHFEIMGKKIVLVSIVKDKDMVVFNLFNSQDLHKYMKIRAESKTNPTDQTPHTPYILFDKSDLFNYANFNIENLIQSFTSLVDYSNEYARTITNHFALETLNYYDQNRNRKDLLKFAEKVFENLETIDPNSLTYFINKMQTIKRDRDFTFVEEDQILEKKMSTPPTDIESTCGLLLLLDSKNEFRLLFSKLPQEKRNIFIEYPIYNLFKSK